MTQASNIFIKDTIIKLLTAIGSEKEIKKYINKFSSTEQQFAVIKVGGAVVEEDLDNLISSLVFLNQVGNNLKKLKMKLKNVRFTVLTVTA